jgi:hypothetical protein
MHYRSRFLPVCGLIGCLLFVAMMIGRPADRSAQPKVDAPAPVVDPILQIVDIGMPGVEDPVALLRNVAADEPAADAAEAELAIPVEEPIALSAAPSREGFALREPVLAAPETAYASDASDPALELFGMPPITVAALQGGMTQGRNEDRPSTEIVDASGRKDREVADDVAAKNETSEAPQEPAPAVEKKPKRELSPGMAALRDRIRKTLATHRRAELGTQQNTPTEIMLGCLPFGCKTEVLLAGKRLNGITCLCWNYPCAGYELLTTCDGHVAARVGYGRQERPSQLLATLALARVESTYPMRVGEDVRSVADLVEYEKLSCRSGDNLSLKLLGLSHYVEEPIWQNDLGETWSIDRMLGEELAAPVVTEPSGGIDRLLALSYALGKRAEKGLPIDGNYQRARKFLADFSAHAVELQNADGSWGPYFLAARSAGRTQDSQLLSTGQILRWLVVTLPEDDLGLAPVVRAANLVNNILSTGRYTSNVAALGTRDIGAMMYGLQALQIYDDRYFKPADPDPAEAKGPAEAKPSGTASPPETTKPADAKRPAGVKKPAASTGTKAEVDREVPATVVVGENNAENAEDASDVVANRSSTSHGSPYAHRHHQSGPAKQNPRGR